MRVAAGAEGGCLELLEACAAKMQHRVKEERRKKKDEIRKKNGMKIEREREKEESNADVIIKCILKCDVSTWW